MSLEKGKELLKQAHKLISDEIRNRFDSEGLTYTPREIDLAAWAAIKAVAERKAT